MEIRVAVCERNLKQREYIVANLKELSYNIACFAYGNIYDLQEVFEENNGAYDVVLIATTLMTKGDGIKLAQRIREINLEVGIIFLAESKDFYQEAFDVFAMSYLLKPIQYQKLDRCFTFYTKNVKTERRVSWMVKGKGGNWVRIFCRDIIYIESDNREIIVHLADGTMIESYGKLGDIEEQLPTANFIRCHQSYIVNMFFVSELRSTAFEMKEESIPISRKFQKIVKERYYQYMFNKI